ncbi:hypothetical protein E2320_000423 [Naja naja]|nr:hypothetical protein E2320_000423 [Naja naja]
MSSSFCFCLRRKPSASLLRKRLFCSDASTLKTVDTLTMKATLFLGAILLMSLVMANEQDQSLPEGKAKSPAQNKTTESESNPPKGNGIMVSEGPVFILLPLMWMMVHLLHM